MFHKFWKIFLFLTILFPGTVLAQSSPPVIGPVTVQTTGNIEKFAKFEVSLNVTTLATNVYFPYDSNPPVGVVGTGINVDMLLLPPGQSNWTNAKTLPCFFYYPPQEVGSGGNIQLQPTGQGEWRCRFTPEIIGTWSYKIKAQDGSGTSESSVAQFTAVNSTRKGFIRVSQTDPKFFEYSDGTPFISPLINVEEGSPFNTISSMRNNIQKLGQGGIRFVRWFPNGEGANYSIIPFGDDIKSSWRFGDRGTWVSAADPVSGHLFGYYPYYYSIQDVYLTPGRYRLSARAKVWGDAVLRLELGQYKRADICSTVGTFHQSQGFTCDYTLDDWNNYSIEATVPSNSLQTIGMRGLYVTTDAPAPFNTVRTGNPTVNSISLQKDETGNGDWGPNLLERGDTDTYKYIDQVSSLAMDELLKVSEQYGVYHKLTLFHKNDNILNRFLPDGTATANWDSSNAPFYSADGQAGRWYQRAYTRYFIARWSYSTALHSLELANETDPWNGNSYNAAISLANYVHTNSPRYILMSDSFWHSFPDVFWSDPQMDYADRHLYAAPDGNDNSVSTIYNDSASYVRQCRNWFTGYETLLTSVKPIVRGEGGSAASGTQPQHPQIAQEGTGVYYHKKVWAHVGNLGYTCDGEWYPLTFATGGAYPNATYDTFKIYKTYENFMANEPVNNGNYQEIGTDLGGKEQVAIATISGSIRAWGLRDKTAGKVLLWIDNRNQTWKNVADGVNIPVASSTLTIQGLPQGNYTGQWWDTRTGAATTTENFTVSGNTLDIKVTNLATDKAIKLTKSHCPPLGNINCLGTVNVIDLSILISKFGGSDIDSDLDDSGKVNVIDLSILLSNFGL